MNLFRRGKQKVPRRYEDGFSDGQTSVYQAFEQDHNHRIQRELRQCCSLIYVNSATSSQRCGHEAHFILGGSWFCWRHFEEAVDQFDRLFSMIAYHGGDWTKPIFGTYFGHLDPNATFYYRRSLTTALDLLCAQAKEESRRRTGAGRVNAVREALP